MSTPDVQNLADDDIDSLIARLNAEKENREASKRQQIMETLEQKGNELKEMAAQVGMTCKIEISISGRGKGTMIRNKVPPKFKNPDNESEVWTGRGNKPRWVATKLAEGVSMNDMLINKD